MRLEKTDYHVSFGKNIDIDITSYYYIHIIYLVAYMFSLHFSENLRNCIQAVDSIFHYNAFNASLAVSVIVSPGPKYSGRRMNIPY